MAEIGQTLHESRIRARIDISEMETRTKIRAKYLRALENEEWDLLPGDIFVKSFLKTYGDALGLDSRLLVDEFKRQFEGPAVLDPRQSVRSSRERERAAREPRGPLLSPRALVATVVLVIVIGLGVYGELSRNNSSSGGSNTPVASTGGGSHKGGSGKTTSTVKSTTTKTVAQTPANTAVTLQIIPTGEVYVCLARSTGTELIPGTIYDTGQTVPTFKAHTFLLELGTRDASLKVNGKVYSVAQNSTPMDLKINVTGVHTTTQSPGCS